jgi:hypothetical protein
MRRKKNRGRHEPDNASPAALLHGETKFLAFYEPCKHMRIEGYCVAHRSFGKNVASELTASPGFSLTRAFPARIRGEDNA